tara:strand:- start:2899 stop:3381 length:483 start_codon:yes stop_codon:yes gene_type:complete
MYLFIFTALIALYQFKSASNYVENTQVALAKYQETAEEYSKISSQIKSLEAQLEMAQLFDLTYNQEGQVALESQYKGPQDVSDFISDALIQTNINKELQHALIPFKSENAKYVFNTVKVLNQKWLIANFTNGTVWGEAILQFSINNGVVNFLTEDAFLYR